MAENRTPGFNKGDKASKGQFKKAQPVKPTAPTPSASLKDTVGNCPKCQKLEAYQYCPTCYEILFPLQAERKKQEAKFERAKKVKLNNAINAYLKFNKAEGEEKTLKQEELLAFKEENESTEEFITRIGSEVSKRKLPFIRTNDLPETEFPKCIMLENYSGVHFWTTFEDGNPLAARQRIEDFVYSSEEIPVSALYERITGEVERDLKEGKSRTCIHLEF